jgi:hypothetical protein
MSTYLLWYNPIKQEYQAGKKEQYNEAASESDESEDFVLLETFNDLTQAGIEKLFDQVNALNGYNLQTVNFSV